MLMELQIAAERLLPLIRARVKRRGFCFADTFTLPLHGSPTTCVVDHVHVPRTTRFDRRRTTIELDGSTVDVTVVQIVQPVEVYIATLADLAAANRHHLPRPTGEDYLLATLEIAFDLFTEDGKDGSSIVLQFAESRPTGLTPPLPPEASDAIAEQLSAFDQRTPIDLKQLQNVLGDVGIRRTGIGVDAHNQVLALRIEIDSAHPESTQSWAAFLLGDVPVHLSVSWDVSSHGHQVETGPNGKPIKDSDGGVTPPTHHTVSGDWTMLIDRRILLAALEDRLTKALERSSQFELHSAVDGEFVANPSQPAFELTFNGDITGVGVFGQNVEVDVTLGASLSVPRHDLVRTGMVLSWDANDWDEFVVGLTNVAFGTFVGADIGAIFGGPVGAVVGAVIGLVGSLIVVTIAAANASPGKLALPSDCRQPNDTTIVCDTELDLPSNEVWGSLTLTQITALGSGPLLVGSLQHAQEVEDVRIDSLTVSDFSWAYADPCGAPVLQATVDIAMTHTGIAPLRLCRRPQIPAGTDPAHQFSGHISTDTLSQDANFTDLRVDVVIPADGLKPAYTNAPYALQLLVQTSGGARWLTLSGLPALTDELVAQLELKLAAEQVNCSTLADRFWATTGRIDPHWLVDPGPEGGGLAAHLWAVQATGLDAGTRIVVESPSGALLATGTASARGVARADALVLAGTGRAGASDEVAIVRVDERAGGTERRSRSPASHGVDAEPRERRLVILQTLLRHAVTIDAGATVVGVQAGRSDGVPVVFCLTDRGVHDVFDVTTPHAPVHVRQTTIMEILGVTAAAPRPVAEHEWFRGAARVGRVVARPAGTAVELWSVGRTERIVSTATMRRHEL